MPRIATLLALAVLVAPVGAGAVDAPFAAWLDVDSAYVHADADLRSPVVGLLRSGDVVTVSACAPDCEASAAWARLGADGAIRLSLLKRSEVDDAHRALGAAARYLYGTVRRDGTPVFATMTAHRPSGRVKAARVLAFRVEQPPEETGWLQTAYGGYVRRTAIRLAKPSLFRGERAPAEVTAFMLRASARWPARGQAGPPVPVDRQARWRVKAFDRNVVETDEGVLRRHDLRLAVAHRRPASVPPQARWVHVDLNEQALTAYEGDRLVFATLVSTGKKGHETPEGIFKVWLKTVHHRMTGSESTPYEVDEVPFTQFFRRGVALHGAFWHDAFGAAVSHGCVNLSLADAEWLFQWAPPELPQGWHAIVPGPTRMEALYVVVERSRPVARWPVPSSEPVTLGAPTPP